MGADGEGALLAELVMGDGQDDGVVPSGEGAFDDVDAIFMHGLFPVDPGIVDFHLGAVAPLFVDDVDDAAVAQVRAVFLEGVRPRMSIFEPLAEPEVRWREWSGAWCLTARSTLEHQA